ncbi:YunC family protein [Vogesella indigofera]|uniref:YunC family protein n=1 Tax=Vogesella indigofera TaxID=45465 RepID=UPI00234F1B2F|nr:DUF1805 domain-containing protein [Vogesella indigofera]MDC7701668.1 DUF1805 domain-containing protein [Vogesella indigofera]
MTNRATIGRVEYLQFELNNPLLVMKAPKGFLGCDYINIETCNNANEVCAIVTGVSSFDEMLAAKVVAISNSAVQLGIKIGESGYDALAKMH